MERNLSSGRPVRIALLIFQLLERLPEGKVLSREELEAIKHTFWLVNISLK